MICHCHRTPKLRHEPRNHPRRHDPNPPVLLGFRLGHTWKHSLWECCLASPEGARVKGRCRRCRVCVCLCVRACYRLAVVWDCLSINFSGCAAAALRISSESENPRRHRDASVTRNRLYDEGTAAVAENLSPSVLGLKFTIGGSNLHPFPDA